VICPTKQNKTKRFNVSHSVIVRLKQRVNQTGSVKERQRTERSLKMTPREDRLLKRLTRQQPFSTTNTLRSQWIVNGRISRRTVNRRLNSTMFRARRPIKRPLLTIRHKTARLQWARDHMGWNIRSWKRVHWSDESRFCRIQLMATSAYGDREIQHFNRNILWAQLRLVEVVLLFGDAFL
jgi:transposase